jgi:hypothetical protein
MGTTEPVWVCSGEEITPIEFNISGSEEVCSGGELTLAGLEFESGQHEVYVNGQFLGYLPVQDDLEWEVFSYRVPQPALRQGNNLVEV